MNQRVYVTEHFKREHSDSADLLREGNCDTVHTFFHMRFRILA
jgi:hypothetical protein